jgi:hypothetical protein
MALISGLSRRSGWKDLAVLGYLADAEAAGGGSPVRYVAAKLMRWRAPARQWRAPD